MKPYDIYQKLKDAWETSTKTCNRFKQAIDSIAWEEQFQADDEHYFCLGDIMFITTSLDPFKTTRSPNIMTGTNTLYFYNDN